MLRTIQVTTLFALSVALWSTAAHGETMIEAQARYHACMDKAKVRPEDAFDDATTWEGLGGGLPARHCALAALVEIGHYSEAAQGLEKLADQVHASAAFKAQILVQSARAWIAANHVEHAGAVAETALKLNPDVPGALMVRAQAFALQGAYWEAADNLSQVIYAQPENAEALVLRGAAYRQLDALDLALDDLNRALILQPDNPEGLLERGIVHRLAGRKSEARRDWRRIIELYPTSKTGEAASANVHKLDSGID